MITYGVDLCIGKKHQDKRLEIKCHDTGVNLRVFLQVCRHGKWKDVFEPYNIPMGSTAVLRIAKPDKKYCIKDGIVGMNGAVLFEMPAQAFTAAGIGKAEVSLFGLDGRRITSATFEIEIPEECICECDLESENYIDVMSEQIAKAIEAAERAENACANGPIIKEGTWWLWDPKNGEYVNSGVNAEASADVDPEAIKDAVYQYMAEHPGESGVQFETDSTLKLENGILSVNTTNQMEKDNTLPITSAGVFATVGNIEALLKTI